MSDNSTWRDVFRTFLLRDGDELVKTIYVKTVTPLNWFMANMNHILPYGDVLNCL